MHRPLAFVAFAVLAGVVLAATVFREQVAYAAQAVEATIVGPLDGNGNIKVHEQGTANVNVTNTPVPVSGTVAVGNLPTVQSVEVANQEPFLAGTQNVNLPIPAGDLAALDTFAVPSGKRLVIQHFSLVCDVAPPQKCGVASLDVSLPGFGAQRQHFIAQEGRIGEFVASETLSLEAQGSVQVTVFRDGTVGTGGFRWAVSGYLVDA